jgi:hypothetical protein
MPFHVCIIFFPAASMNAAAIDLLQREISNPGTQWSLGTFGAIAEFSRDPDEPVRLVSSGRILSAVTSRGAIVLKPDAAPRAFASEGLTKTGWSQRVSLCLPKQDCAMSLRTALTEIGPDRDAPREEDRHSVLFDLGFGALHADFCVRADESLSSRLREHAGRDVFEPGNPAMGMILTANPHRVFFSQLGRIEVYQPIPPPSGKSPEGPHTHVLPRLLRNRRTHPATEPVPDGMVPCAHLYPPHPARDALGEPRQFDATHHDAFQAMMAACGDPAALATKRRVVDAVLAGEPPTVVAGDRHGRISVRIALRQMKSQGHASAALTAWLASFDQAAPDEAEDEAALQHEG